MSNVYAYRSLVDFHRTSTSGGAFTQLAMNFFAQGGDVVYGVVLDENLAVRHQRACTLSDCEKFKKSKYVQSDLRGIFQSVTTDISKNLKVLFTGTPCQINALYTYLDKLHLPHGQVYTIDVICNGAPSAKVWTDYTSWLEKRYDIKVSVCCFTYNHAPYLSKALDSVLSQKTNFRYEIIIGDDCSTDGSQDIINAYAIKFPDLIKTIYQPVNSRGKKNFSDVYKSAEGQYVIALETDDYWTDPNKLQIQVDYLDRHPACIAVAHNCVVVDEHDRQLARKYPAIDQGVYRYKHFRKGLMPGQTTTVLYRNPKFVENLDMSLYNNPISGPGDSRRLFCLMTAGDVITLPYTMSAYRYVTSGGYSFSANHKRDDKSALLFFREFQIYADKFTNKPMRLAADVRLMQVALGALKHRQIDLKEWIQYYRSCQFPFKALICAAAKIIQHKLNRNN